MANKGSKRPLQEKLHRCSNKSERRQTNEKTLHVHGQKEYENGPKQFIDSVLFPSKLLWTFITELEKNQKSI